MKFELQISLDNTALSFQKVDLFPDQQLEYDLDFYDSLDVGKVKLPFYTELKIPLTTTNQASNRFNFDPFNSASIDFPKQDFYFKINIFGSTTTEITGILNVKSFEYNSSLSFIQVELKDFLSTYISKIKGEKLGVIYDDNYHTQRQTITNFLLNEKGTLNQNPDYTRPIAFPYVDFCNDVDGKFGYAARQFLEYGPGMTRAGIVPSFSVQGFLEYLARYISTNDFPLRADSKLFEIGAFDGITGLTDFEPEKLQFIPPARLLAKQDINTRNFFLRQGPNWSGTNQSLNECTLYDGSTKIMHTEYFGDIETCGNYGTDSEGMPLYSVSEWGAEKRMNTYPFNNTTINISGIRGFFAPKVSFNSSIGFNSGNASVNVPLLKFEIPVVGDDKMVYGINVDSPDSTMRWKFYIGVYRDGEMVKKIALQDSLDGDDIILTLQDLVFIGPPTGQSMSNKRSNSDPYDFFSCDEAHLGDGVILAPQYQTSYRDTLNFDSFDAWFPTGEELMIDSGSEYSINYFLEAFDGEILIDYVTAFDNSQGNHHFSSAYNSGLFGADRLLKTVTRINDYGPLDIKFTSNADVLPHKQTDEVIIQDSIIQSCPLNLLDVLTATLKRFECGLFYEYDDSDPDPALHTHVLRVDPLSFARTGGQDINPLLDDLKSVKMSNGGDKVKSVEIKNKSYSAYFDDQDNDGITIGSTVQEINTEGIVEIKIGLDSSIYYKSVCGGESDSEAFNSNFGAFSAKQLGFTTNVFTMNKDVGLRFAFLDKPLYKTALLTPIATLEGFRTDDKMNTESQIIYQNQITTISDIIKGQHIFNGRLFNYNTAGWNLMFENESGVVEDAYTDIFGVSEKILQSESPRIEFDIVVPTANLANLNFFLQTLSATNFTPNGILVKSAKGDVYDDHAYLTIEGILQ